ncbi:hypothetical protein MRB53_041885 [Persea americana]|nr:hypothetical protein MRB53_041885 [Persea americana]
MGDLEKLQASIAPAEKLALLNAFRSSLDSGHDIHSLIASQSEALPHMLHFLTTSAPNFRADTVEQQCRQCILESIQRFTFGESLKPHINSLLTAILDLLQNDNEDNGCICLKIFIDLHKAYKTFIESFVQPFLDIVLKIYQSMPQTLRAAFDAEAPTGDQQHSTIREESSSPSEFDARSDNRILAKSSHSFKVLTECPIIIVLLFSTYRQIVQPNLVLFTPAIIDMLALQGPDRQDLGADVPGKQYRTLASFLLAQIKTLSFLAYVLRGFTTYMRKYAPIIPQFVLRLLQDCPPEMSAARKVCCLTWRHCGILVHASQLTCRPLAYSMLADLIHHVRAELNSGQIRKTILVYSKNLLDPSLSSSIQTMSAKLLLNMIDRIMKLGDHIEARDILMLILSCFNEKITSLNLLYGRKSTTSDKFDRYSLLREFGIQLVTLNTDQDVDPIKEGKALFKNLIIGLKTVLFGLKSCNPPAPASLSSATQWSDAVRGLTSADIHTFANLFRGGSSGFRYYSTDDTKESRPWEKSSLESPLHLLTSNSREEKDILETFATVFVHLDAAAFQEIFEMCLPDFYESIASNALLLHIPQFFLTNESTSPIFAGLLIQFLVDRLDELGSEDVLRNSILLRLFKMCFMAVTMFPDLNECILQPHLASLIIRSMKLATEASTPINFYILMRALFRSIGGGRFELLYKEVLPLLQVLLECLNNLLKSTRKSAERELFVELCLTVQCA